MKYANTQTIAVDYKLITLKTWPEYIAAFENNFGKDSIWKLTVEQVANIQKQLMKNFNSNFKGEKVMQKQKFTLAEIYAHSSCSKNDGCIHSLKATCYVCGKGWDAHNGHKCTFPPMDGNDNGVFDECLKYMFDGITEEQIAFYSEETQLTNVFENKKTVEEIRQASYIYKPRTQKAKSVRALQSTDYPVPDFMIFSANVFNKREESNGQALLFPEKNEAAYSLLLNRFVRPCPMVPRHGFVDSRPINTIEEAEQLINETLAVEPQAELISMPFIDSQFSAIWTNGRLVIGTGNDGATAGIQSRMIPALGELVSEHAKSKAGITEAPYVELLWLKKYESWKEFYVQLRNGPKLPAAINFVPFDNYEVKNVFVAEAKKNEKGLAVVFDANGNEVDLLAWESQVKTLPANTAIYHPGGDLASHVAVHAVLAGHAVCCDFRPTIGQVLKQEVKTKTPNVEKMKTGFYIGATCNIDYPNAVFAMLAGCHQTAIWQGEVDYLLGFAMGCAYRLTVTASLGEFRHQPGRKRKASRNAVYTKVWKKVLTNATRTRILKALYSFSNDNWPSSFGGKKWFEFLQFSCKMYNALIDGNAKDALMYLNQTVHAAHNGGWAFNKFVSGDQLDECAKCPVKTMVRCAPNLYLALTTCEENETAGEWFKKRQHIETDETDLKGACNDDADEIEDENEDDGDSYDECPSCGKQITCDCGQCHCEDEKSTSDNYSMEGKSEKINGNVVMAHAKFVENTLHIQYKTDAMPDGKNYYSMDVSLDGWKEYFPMPSSEYFEPSYNGVTPYVKLAFWQTPEGKKSNWFAWPITGESKNMLGAIYVDTKKNLLYLTIVPKGKN